MSEPASCFSVTSALITGWHQDLLLKVNVIYEPWDNLCRLGSLHSQPENQQQLLSLSPEIQWWWQIFRQGNGSYLVSHARREITWIEKLCFHLTFTMYEPDDAINFPAFFCSSLFHLSKRESSHFFHLPFSPLSTFLLFIFIPLSDSGLLILPFSSLLSFLFNFLDIYIQHMQDPKMWFSTLSRDLQVLRLHRPFWKSWQNSILSWTIFWWGHESIKI